MEFIFPTVNDYAIILYIVTLRIKHKIVMPVSGILSILYQEMVGSGVKDIVLKRG